MFLQFCLCSGNPFFLCHFLSFLRSEPNGFSAAEADVAERPEAQNYPLWRDVIYLRDHEEIDADTNAQPLTQHLKNIPQSWETGPDLVSFHSFKGGVGRTTALMTYVAACLQDAGLSNLLDG